jgi:hypothetical protein
MHLLWELEVWTNTAEKLKHEHIRCLAYLYVPGSKHETHPFLNVWQLGECIQICLVFKYFFSYSLLIRIAFNIILSKKFHCTRVGHAMWWLRRTNFWAPPPSLAGEGLNRPCVAAAAFCRRHGSTCHYCWCLELIIETKDFIQLSLKFHNKCVLFWGQLIFLLQWKAKLSGSNRPIQRNVQTEKYSKVVKWVHTCSP